MTEKPTLNAKVAAVGLVSGALLLHIVNQFDYKLIPVRLFIVAILVFAAWAFSDEMGMRRPLNRAGFVVFMFSMLALGASVVDIDSEILGQLYLIYSLSLMFAVLIWSIAFLHRQRELKVVGTIGAAATAIPILLIVAGHISVGAGAYFGFSGLITLSNASAVLGSTPINIVEAIFLSWTAIAAIMLWKGSVDTKRATT